MKAEIRPYESQDSQGVADLRLHAFPGIPEVQDARYHSYVHSWLKTHPLGEQVYRWVAVADGRVVGHLAAIPQYYRINGRRVIAHTPADLMAHARYGLQAFALMRRFFRATENYVSCDMVPAVIAIETRLGAELAGPLWYAAKLLNVSRLPVPSLPAPARRLLNIGEQTARARGYASRPGAELQDAEEHVAPLPVRPRMPIPTPVKGLLNGALWAVDEGLGSAFGTALKVEKLGGFDESFDELFERVAASVPCNTERDAAFLRWRYGPGSPQAPLTVLGVKGGETLLGYVVLKVASTGQDVYVFDLTTLPGRCDVARALLREVIRYSRQRGVQIVRYRFLESPTSARSGDLRRLGYFRRRGRNNNLLVRFADRGLHETAREAANWSYTVGDGEATFWTR